MARPSNVYRNNKELTALGLAIRTIRLDQGFSQEAFADHIEIDRSYFGGIERGEHNIAIMNLVKISRGLNIRVSDLLDLAKL